MEQIVDTRERQLLAAYVEARNIKESWDAGAKEAGKKLMEAEREVIDYLTDAGKKSTGAYDELGSVAITDPIFTARVEEGRNAEAYEYVRRLGAGACIKETIHHATFTSLMREQAEKGTALPDFVKVFYVPQVKYNKPKGGKTNE